MASAVERAAIKEQDRAINKHDEYLEDMKNG